MKLLFLRGWVSFDRELKESRFPSLEASDDMWEHLANALGDETEIVYLGGNEVVEYSPTCRVRRIKHPSVPIDFKPDVVFCRGGFREYGRICDQFPKAYKIYYCAGVRRIPMDGVKYNLVLVDTANEKRYFHGPGKARLWYKPAAPCFKPVPVEKEFDICYVANKKQYFLKSKRPFYEAFNGKFKILHLGFHENEEINGTITRRRVPRKDMATEYSRCKIGVVPYRDYDSCPRVIPEMIACGLPIVGSKSVNVDDFYVISRGNIPKLPQIAKEVLVAYGPAMINHMAEKAQKLTVQAAATQIKGLINES